MKIFLNRPANWHTCTTAKQKRVFHNSWLQAITEISSKLTRFHTIRVSNKYVPRKKKFSPTHVTRTRRNSRHTFSTSSSPSSLFFLFFFFFRITPKDVHRMKKERKISPFFWRKFIDIKFIIRTVAYCFREQTAPVFKRNCSDREKAQKMFKLIYRGFLLLLAPLLAPSSLFFSFFSSFSISLLEFHTPGVRCDLRHSSIQQASKKFSKILHIFTSAGLEDFGFGSLRWCRKWGCNTKRKIIRTNPRRRRRKSFRIYENKNFWGYFRLAFFENVCKNLRKNSEKENFDPSFMVDFFSLSVSASLRAVFILLRSLTLFFPSLAPPPPIFTTLADTLLVWRQHRAKKFYRRVFRGGNFFSSFGKGWDRLLCEEQVKSIISVWKDTKLF